MSGQPIFEVKLETPKETVIRLIADDNYIHALRIGIGKMPDDIEGPFRISCTRLCELTDLHEELAHA